MTKQKLALGKGARVSVLLKFLHPSADVRTNFPHRHPQDRLENAEVLRIEKKRITRKDQQAVVMRHQSFGDKEVYAVVRFCRVTSEGPDTFFPQAGEDDASSLEESGQKEHPQDILELQQKRGIFLPDDIEAACALVEIDDDNEPAPENLPGQTIEQVFGEEWVDVSVCNRRQTNVRNVTPSLNFKKDIKLSKLQLFELMFPMEFVSSVIIPKINSKIQGKKVTKGEFLRWLGMWLLMATINGKKEEIFFSFRGE